MAYIPFFQSSKKFGFMKVPPIVFKEFGGLKLQIVKFWDSQFVELVILHLYCSFCAVSFKSDFGEFLNIEPILDKIGMK